MNDLFEPPAKLRGKMKDLAMFIRDARLCRTSDVVQWGLDNFYVSAERAAQLLAERGYLRRMTDEEVRSYFHRDINQGVWVPTKQLRDANL